MGEREHTRKRQAIFEQTSKPWEAVSALHHSVFNWIISHNSLLMADTITFDLYASLKGFKKVIRSAWPGASTGFVCDNWLSSNNEQYKVVAFNNYKTWQKETVGPPLQLFYNEHITMLCLDAAVKYCGQFRKDSACSVLNLTQLWRDETHVKCRSW